VLGLGIALVGIFAAGSYAKRAFHSETGVLVVAAMLLAAADALAMVLVLLGVV
jgi:hypothetical protein